MEISVGDVVQIDPAHEVFGGCFLVVHHVSEQVTPQSVHAAIDACNAERARANAQVPELNLPKQPYPDEIEQDHPDEIEQDEPQDEGH